MNIQSREDSPEEKIGYLRSALDRSEIRGDKFRERAWSAERRLDAAREAWALVESTNGQGVEEMDTALAETKGENDEQSTS